MRIIFAALFFAFTANATESASEPKLRIHSPSEEKTFTRAELLKRPGVKTLILADDQAYKSKNTNYTAVPLAELFEGMTMPEDATISFVALDGYSAAINKDRVLNKDPKKSIAYLAVETADKPWPALKASQSPQSAGPFYLVWENPSFSQIQPEEWAYELAGFEIKPSLQSQFPHIFPDPNLPENSPVRKGFKAFTANCFACHTMNGEGSSQLGPDLNIPYGPTEYLRPGFLEKQIRNPQSVKYNPQGKMHGFDPKELPEADLKNIIAYLNHMTHRKIPVPTSAH